LLPFLTALGAGAAYAQPPVFYRRVRDIVIVIVIVMDGYQFGLF